VDKAGYSSNGKIVPAELLPLMAKWTLLLNFSVFTTVETYSRSPHERIAENGIALA